MKHPLTQRKEAAEFMVSLSENNRNEIFKQFDLGPLITQLSQLRKFASDPACSAETKLLLNTVIIELEKDLDQRFRNLCTIIVQDDAILTTFFDCVDGSQMMN